MRSKSIKKWNPENLPDSAMIKKELDRVKGKRRYRSILKQTIFTLITVSAVAVLIATLMFPVLRIHGSSMNPTLNEGNLVLSVKTGTFKPQDVIAFYYNNKILVKRVIAGPGQWVDITPEGKVSVDGNYLDEPYVSTPALGECDIELPYQVPDGRYFVMGDHRDTSADSRLSEIGCIPEELVVGKIIQVLWPLNEFSPMSMK